LLDQADDTQMSDVPSSGGSISLVHQMQQILNPQGRRIEASAYSGHKRKEMSHTPAAASSSSSSIWGANTFLHPGMASIMQNLESNGVDDTITLGQLNANKFNKF
jgi:hypothetical protein